MQGKRIPLARLGHYDISVDDLLCGIPKEKKSEQTENLILEYLSQGKYPQYALLKKAQAAGISKCVPDGGVMVSFLKDIPCTSESPRHLCNRQVESVMINYAL